MSTRTPELLCPYADTTAGEASLHTLWVRLSGSNLKPHRLSGTDLELCGNSVISFRRLKFQ